MLSSLFSRLARRIRASRSPAIDSRAKSDPARQVGAGHAGDPAGQSDASLDFESMLHDAIGRARAGDLHAALPILQRVVAAMPQRADALTALGNVMQLLGRHEEAEDSYRGATAVDPLADAAWANLGLCLRHAGKIPQAKDALERALTLAPAQHETRLTLALVQIDAGKLDEGELLLRQLLREAPDLAEAHTALSHVLLLRGAYEEGWREYEWRLRLPSSDARAPLPVPAWDGSAAHGKTVLVTSEQGLGDQVMLMSCMPDILSRAGQCWVECDPRLCGLVERSFPGVVAIPYEPREHLAWRRDARPDLQVAFGSLPAMFRRRSEEFPNHAGYLQADPVRVGAWRARLAALGTGPKVGISWRGGAPTTRGALRSLPLSAWQPLLDLPAHFVSLQYGECTAEMKACSAHRGRRPLHFPEAIPDYDETAALVEALDLVISVQTSVAHLAGALGKETWVLVPLAPEWRYMAETARMPWYPSVRLFRQDRFGYWENVLARVSDELRSLCRARSSSGETADR